MKYYIFWLVFMLIPFSVHAEDMTSKEVIELCSGVAKNAEILMELRQSGVPMDEVLKASDGEVVIRLAVKAYKWPVIKDQSTRKEVIADFRDSMHAQCLEAGLAKLAK